MTNINNEPIAGIIGPLAIVLEREQLWWVVRSTCDRYRVCAKELFGRRRVANIARARIALYIVLHDSLGYCFSEIARIVGRDHTTVMSAIRQNHDRLSVEYRGHVVREPWVAKVAARTERLARDMRAGEQ